MSLIRHSLVLATLLSSSCVEEVPDITEDEETTGAMEQVVRPTEGPAASRIGGEVAIEGGNDVEEATRARQALRARYEKLLGAYREEKSALRPGSEGELREVEKHLTRARELLFYIEKQRNRVWEQSREELEEELDDVEQGLSELTSRSG